ncbi:MAG: LytTR family transcriptional regulator [Bacteroidales bacterium]
MLPHPFTNSTRSIIAGSLIILSAIAVLGGLLMLYGDLPPVNASVDAIIFVGVLSVCGMLSWFSFGYMRVWQAQLAVSFLIQIICLGVCYRTMSLLAPETIETFRKTLPLHLLVGICSWAMLMQWYRMLQMKEDMKQEKTNEEKTENLPAAEPAEWLDRISVKDGGRIHIVHLKDLYCIQACGDYANLFTDSGQYIKEQTMKYFETHLPPVTFVRIHRSVIVNTDYIMRIELFGKETYQVRLKNGVSLKVSNAGYKLLKERLNL